MDIQQVLRELKPLIGQRAERYWLAWLSEDAAGRAEIEIALGLLHVQLLGSNVALPDVHLSVPPKEQAQGDYGIGEVVYGGKQLHPFGLRDDEWIQHLAVFGRSGAGKTNAVFHILETFLDRQKPFLIFDWKRNYRDLLAMRDEAILVYTAGRGAVPFAFNPLIPPHDTDPAVWLKKLIEIIARAYFVGEGVMYMLQEAIHAVYTEHGVYTARPETYPTFQDVLKWLEDHPVKGRKALWMDSALRCLKSLCFGHMGTVVNTAVQPNLAALLDRNVILELDSLTNNDKSMLIQSLLLWIHHWRLAQPDRETFKHALIIEEAHHILLRQTGAGSGGEAVTDTIIREIRELGEAIILVDQHPSLISIPALGNTHTTISMNLKHRSDVNAVGAAMLLEDEQRDLLGRLPIGQAIIKLQSRWTQPFLIQIPHRKVPKGAVNDTQLIHLMQGRNTLHRPTKTGNVQAFQHPPPSGPLELSQIEERFLASILEQPLLATVERYNALALSRRKGNALRETCLAKKLVAAVDIPTRRGKTVLLELTPTGRTALQRLGRNVPDRERWGGAEHEYWKHQVADKLQLAGWQVTIEQPVNGHADIAAELNGKRVAVEIETGKSDWRANLNKNLGQNFNEILILATNASAYSRIAAALKDPPSDVAVRLEQVQDWLESSIVAQPKLKSE